MAARPAWGCSNGQYCVTLNSGSGQVILGWGGASVSASLTANVNYTLSFQASASSSLSGFETHVGSAVSVGGSYPVDKDLGNDTIGTGLQTFTHMFTLTAADAQAGLAFLISVSTGTSTVCLDNVSVTANLERDRNKWGSAIRSTGVARPVGMTVRRRTRMGS